MFQAVPEGPTPHKDPIITSLSPAGHQSRAYSGLSISLSLLGRAQSQPQSSNLMAAFVLESRCGKVIKV